MQNNSKQIQSDSEKNPKNISMNQVISYDIV